MTTVWGTAMVVDAGVLRYHGWENALVDVSGWEVGIPEVARLIRIVELKLQRFGESII